MLRRQDIQSTHLTIDYYETIACDLNKEVTFDTNVSIILNKITCEDCIKTKAYKKALLDFELKFDGNVNAYVVHLHEKYQKTQRKEPK